VSLSSTFRRYRRSAVRVFTSFGRGRGSLRLRLLLAAFISTGIAVAVAGTAMVILVNRHIERRVVYELRGYLDQLTGRFDIDEGKPDIRADLADPRFDRPYSGLYWQVSEKGEARIRSRSLWDQILPLTGEALEDFNDNAFQIPGPHQQTLIAVSRRVTLGHPPSSPERMFDLVVAIDRGEIDQVTEDYAIETAAFLIALVLFLGVAGWVQVTVGLRPLDGLRQMIFAVRGGRADRLSGAFPDEVIPLVEEVNALIDAQSQTIERARARAGDLAHGLKTPLAVIASETRLMRENGDTASADIIDAEVEGMSRFIERQLARARITSLQRHGRRIDLDTLIKRLVRTMKRLPRGDEVFWDVNLGPGLGIALQTEDADEIFGNILDNARKFATSNVEITATFDAGFVNVRVADDGPGVPPSRREAVLLRGLRLDETVQGSGLGLSIVDDLVSSYRGRIKLDETPGGGLTIDLQLPSSEEPAGPM
jgi:signal transduction histidine kinase